MSYDYGGREVNGVAPMPWIQLNVRMLLEDQAWHASKLLIGVNFYGRCSNKQAILGHDFIKQLDAKNSKLYWNEVSKESILKSSSSICYFPTKKSIKTRLDFVQTEQLAGWLLSRSFAPLLFDFQLFRCRVLGAWPRPKSFHNTSLAPYRFIFAYDHRSKLYNFPPQKTVRLSLTAYD